MMNSDTRAVLTGVFKNLGSDGGKLSIEQFSIVLKHFGLLDGASSSSSFGLSDMLICRFVDRDGDGMISVDDIFSTQALILQRSEVFVRAIFRPLTHSLTYSLTHSLTHLLTHPFTHSHTHSLTHSLTHSPTHSPTHPTRYLCGLYFVCIKKQSGIQGGS